MEAAVLSVCVTNRALLARLPVIRQSNDRRHVEIITTSKRRGRNVPTTLSSSAAVRLKIKPITGQMLKRQY